MKRKEANWKNRYVEMHLLVEEEASPRIKVRMEGSGSRERPPASDETGWWDD